MGTKYSSTLPTGYNSNPPADDGSQVASNKVKYSTIKSKLADPLNTYASSLDTALQAAFDTSSSITSVDYTTVASDHLKPIEASGTTTISLGDAATMESGYRAIVANVGTGIITVGVATDTDTLNGATDGTITLLPNDCVTFTVNQGADGYEVISKFVGTSPVGSVLQVKTAQLLTYVSTGDIIPLDDTIPQNTEGVEVLTCSITPKSASSKLRVEVWSGSVQASGGIPVGAVFRDTTANAIIARYTASTADLNMTVVVDSVATTETTFKFRAGSSTTGEIDFNGNTTARLLGGASAVYMVVTEIAA